MEPAYSETFGELLRDYRRQAGFTQEELAERAELSVRGLKYLESDERRPHAGTIRRIADALDLTDAERARLLSAAAVGSGWSVLAGGARDETAGEALPPTSEPEGPAPALPTAGFLGALPADPLVAREEELSRIDAAIASVEAGEGRLFVLTGEPGVGKTRLAQEATLHLRDRGFRVAAGSCFEPRQAVPYYPFLDILATLYALASPAARAQVTTRWPYLSRLLPDPDVTLPPAGAAGPEEQERLFRAVSGFVLALAEEAPVALLLDDLHWADRATLDLFLHLAHHTRGQRVFVLGTHRDTGVVADRLLADMALELERQQLLERIPVRRLDEAQTAALVAATFGLPRNPETFAVFLHRHTEGNPFLIRELLRALVEEGAIYQDEDGRWSRRDIDQITVPASVRALLRQRLSRLSTEAQDVLREASVLGQTFGFGRLRAMGQRPEEAVEKALDAAIDAEIVWETERDCYAFNHALIQQTLYDEVPARRRRRLHRAAAESIENTSTARQEKAAELAWHLLQADEAERALPYLVLAGDQAENVFAHAEAERQYRQALDITRRLPLPAETRSRQEAEVLEKLGRTLSLAGRYDDALPLLEQAAERYDEHQDLEAVARVTARIGWTYHDRGDAAVGIARIQPLLQRLSGAIPSHGLASLYLALSYLHHGSAHYQDTLDAAERAAGLARSLGDERILAAAEMRRGTALLKLGEIDEGMRVLEGSIPLLEAVGDLEVLALAYNNLGSAYCELGQREPARASVERALAIEQKIGNAGHLGFMHLNLAEILTILGEWDEAEANIERGAAILETLGASWFGADVPLRRGHLLLGRGQWEEAAEELERAVMVGKSLGDQQGLEYTLCLLAELELRQGRAEAAAARLQEATEEGSISAWLLTMLAWAHLALGELDRAEETVKRAITLSRERRQVEHLPVALTVQGLILEASGRWTEAVASLDEAARLAHSMPYPYAEARALYERGRLESRRGIAVNECLQAALAIFVRLGAMKDMEDVERLAREIESTLPS